MRNVTRVIVAHSITLRRIRRASPTFSSASHHGVRSLHLANQVILVKTATLEYLVGGLGRLEFSQFLARLRFLVDMLAILLELLKVLN